MNMADPTAALQDFIQNYHSSNMFFVFAGISGALAVILGAYGNHSKVLNEPQNAKCKQAFESGNKYHLIHSIVLLALPLMRRPLLVGCLMLSGKLLFCGSLYLYAFTLNPKLSRFAPIGGCLLISGWLAIAF